MPDTPTKPKRRRLFTTVPTGAIGDRSLTALELRALMAVSIHDGMSLMKRTGAGCYAKLSTLAELVQTDISTISKAIHRLENAGYIVRQRQKMDRRRFTLRVVFEPEDEDVAGSSSSEPDGTLTAADPDEIVDRAMQRDGEIVDYENLESRGNLPNSAQHYIPQSGELNSDKSAEKDSVETAQIDDEILTEPDDLSDDVRNERPAKAQESAIGHESSEAVCLRSLLLSEWEHLNTELQLCNFEGVLDSIGWDFASVSRSERDEFGSWLHSVLEARQDDGAGMHAAKILTKLRGL